ncbi:hypothetical protein FOXG_09634 [Fusarium oxysporum f. sp. lycopersici 4287]|uniref:Uncharacterized protein n=1 Tax=Fusarium oxysporum f. sp. lycopersici (strain 4287 / CBS 123668 / FGSC 9935 / NRRL 34936) TaxID=426428 RepID=A0A0J9VD41_FUSO4|nr:hypothetical protein FOXG_09634 [Fusarium oxysporum f. sp. lycopersici 4287]KNB08950.1 hypothetical protein FOXG_09634 [Fusarium oxysporum f. sp. lycopersici 4287]
MPAMIAKRPGLMQISVSRSAEEQRLIPAYCSNLARRAKELETFRKHLYADAKGGELSFGIMERISPHAVAVSHPLFSRLEQLHVLLGRVFVDIVDRWFTDEKARFPERMPLDPSEEELLPMGSVYPDGLRDESPYVCEINGRLPLNAVMGIALGENGLLELGASKGGLEPVNSMDASYNNLMALFDPDKPLFSIRDKWPGADSKILSAVNVARGRPPVEAVRPQDLEVRPDENSPTGFSLWDKATNRLLEQWFVEMLQEEYADLEPAVARQLSLTPLNDLRTVFIVHDKRLLGIIPEELPKMVSRGVLTAEEADIVADGITQTINPGSEGLQNLLRESKSDSDIKNYYIYKPCRDGMGHGIELGKNLTQEAWLERLEKLANPDVLRPHDDAAVIQRLVDHNWYDVVRHEVSTDDGPKPNKFHLIGSMFMFQNRKFYPATWRMGLETHLGITSDKPGLVMGMVHQPDWPIGENQEQEL